MKKLFTLRNILVCLGALLAVGSFFIAFAAGFSYTEDTLHGSATVIVSNVIIGKRFITTIIGNIASINAVENAAHAGLSLAGIIMMLIAGLAACVFAFVFGKHKWAKWVIVGCAVVILTGAIFAFCMKDSYILSSVDKLIKDGDFPASQRQTLINDYRETLKNAKLNVGYVFTGLFGVFGALIIAASQFVKEK